MHDLIKKFPLQLQEAIDSFSDLSSHINTIKDTTWTHILCLGMGGSGIAGTLLQTIMNHEGSIPYTVCKDYTIPHRVNPKTLIIACSHSGNTEETLTAVGECKEKDAHIVVITSGGTLKEVAQQQGYPLILLPDGMMPRAAYTYAVVAQLSLLGQLGIIPLYLEDIKKAITTITVSEESFVATAKHIAQHCAHKTPVLYTDPLFEPVARRTRQQLNENSKILCRHAIIPEMNHNEILGRHDESRQFIPLFLRHNYEHPRNSYRIDLTKEVIRPLVDEIIEIQATGVSLVEQMLTTIYILDRVSVYLADIRTIDATEIPTIVRLKQKLAEK